VDADGGNSSVVAGRHVVDGRLVVHVHAHADLRAQINVTPCVC
jgi:hypothetical protein